MMTRCRSTVAAMPASSMMTTSPAASEAAWWSWKRGNVNASIAGAVSQFAGGAGGGGDADDAPPGRSRRGPRGRRRACRSCRSRPARRARSPVRPVGTDGADGGGLIGTQRGGVDDVFDVADRRRDGDRGGVGDGVGGLGFDGQQAVAGPALLPPGRRRRMTPGGRGMGMSSGWARTQRVASSRQCGETPAGR